MNSLLIASTQHGAGGTTLVCQFAHYLRRAKRLRVLVVDLVNPPDSRAFFARGAHPCIKACGGPNGLLGLSRPAAPHISILAADDIPGLISDDDPSRARYYANLRHLLSIAAPWFDVCVIDAPTWPDLRTICAAGLADAMVSPIRVLPDVVKQTARFINGVQGMRTVRAKLNPALRFVGFLPNRIERMPAWRTQVSTLRASLGVWLASDAAAPGGVLCLPRSDALVQAQRLGVSVDEVARSDTIAHEASDALQMCLRLLARQCDWRAHNDADRAVRNVEVCVEVHHG